MNSNQNIFIFTAGDPAARAHLADSISNPIDLSRVSEFFDLKDRELVSQINSEHGLYAWGAIPGTQNNPRWGQIKAGDWMLCVFDSTYHYVAQVTAKFENEKFAKDLAKYNCGFNDAYQLLSKNAAVELYQQIKKNPSLGQGRSIF